MTKYLDVRKKGSRGGGGFRVCVCVGEEEWLSGHSWEEARQSSAAEG